MARGVGDRFESISAVTSSWCAVSFRSWTTTVQARKKETENENDFNRLRMCS